MKAANSSGFLPSKEFLPKSELVFSQLFATIPLVFTFDAKRDSLESRKGVHLWHLDAAGKPSFRKEVFLELFL